MSRQVVCTSSSGLDYLGLNHDIELIRLRIFMNNVEFTDGKNINLKGLTDLMLRPSYTPTRTSPAPKTEVAELFDKLLYKGVKEVFVVCLSSGISESYATISEVASRYAGKMDIHIYDTKEINICEAVLALEAQRLMKQGATMPDITQRLDVLRASHSMMFALEDLTHLINNKKLSKAGGLIANLLNIKPVLQVTDAGIIEPVNRIRKFERALEHVIDVYADTLRRPDSFAYILSSGRTLMDVNFAQMIKDRVGITNLPVLPTSAISLANHGPTGVGLCVFEGEIPESIQRLSQN